VRCVNDDDEVAADGKCDAAAAAAAPAAGSRDSGWSVRPSLTQTCSVPCHDDASSSTSSSSACVFSQWTAWSPCSRRCDGLRARFRYMEGRSASYLSQSLQLILPRILSSSAEADRNLSAALLTRFIGPTCCAATFVSHHRRPLWLLAYCSLRYFRVFRLPLSCVLPKTHGLYRLRVGHLLVGSTDVVLLVYNVVTSVVFDV